MLQLIVLELALAAGPVLAAFHLVYPLIVVVILIDAMIPCDCPSPSLAPQSVEPD